MPGTVSEDVLKIAAIGRDVTPQTIQASAGLYAPLHETEPYADVTLTRDIAYGPHERHRLDVFVPDSGGGRLPVVVFVHGGGFIGGDKKMPDSPYNDNVPLWAARHDMIGVNMTYRLAPDHQWPAGAEDVAAAIRWVRDNIADHGGDPEQIYLMGTSAGAVHVASYVAKPQFGDPDRDIAGAMLLSCIYDLETAEKNDILKSYFGEDPVRYPECSSLQGLVETEVPLLATVAEYDPQDFERQALAFVGAFFERHGKWPNFIRLMGHNHLTTTMHLNAVDSHLSDQLLRFITAPETRV